MPRSHLRTQCRSIGLTLLVMLSCGTRVDAAGGLAWQPHRVEKTLGNGSEPDVVTLTFTSVRALRQVQMTVSPAFRRFIRRLEPDHVDGVQPGQGYTIEVHFTVPAGQAVGVYHGRLMAHAGGRPAVLPIALTVDYGDSLVSDTTHALSPATAQSLTSVTTDTLTFTAVTKELEQLEPGDVVALAPTEAAPSGALRMVTGVTLDGAQVVLGTSPATLEDAVTNGSVHVDQALTTLAASLRLPQGVTIRRPAEAGATGGGFYLTIDEVVLYDHDHCDCTTNDRITASGSVLVDPHFTFDLVIESGQIRHLSLVDTTTETAQITVAAGVSVTVNPEYELPPIRLQPVVTFVGWVPVVIEPRLTVRIGVDGSVSAGISAGVTQQATLTIGLSYDDGVWTPISSFTPSIDFEPPSLSAACSFRGYAGPRLDLLLYGVAGPYFTLDGYLELDADPFQDPWWSLYGGIEAGAGLHVEILGHELADYEAPAVIGYRVLLAEAPTCASASAIVDAKLGWQDSGIAVATGDRVSLAATGMWGDSAGTVDANGRASQLCSNSSCPLVNEPVMRLVGRVGATGAVFAVGTASALDAGASGTLRFSANDVPGIFWDNTGSLNVSARICPP